MKIFSNFDTKLRRKTFEEYKEKHGEENVICFGRSRLYQMYKVILPGLGIAIFTVLFLMFFYRRLNGNYFYYIITIIVLVDIVFIFPIIGKFIDYKMDFIVVIPHSIIAYDQDGIFRRNVVTVSAQSVKTITIQKPSLLYSMFDNGDLIILTEGDTEHNGEQVLKRIPRPEKRRNEIIKIIGIDFQANQNPQI